MAKRPRPVAEVKQHREPKLAHADFERLAKVEAENRSRERHEMIAAAAYFRAQQRGFEPGHELEDWLSAEAAIVHSQQQGRIEAGS